MSKSHTARFSTLLHRATFLLALACALVATNAAAEIRGQVSTTAGAPVEAVRVEEVHSGETVSTDARGNFVLATVKAPFLLLVRHPRFEEQVLELATLPTEPLSLVIEAKQAIYEEIVVSARRGGDSLSPTSIASTVIEPIKNGPPPSTISDAVTAVAGVSENGQGGLFQVVSIRGVSRNRVLTLIDGMRIVTERRAGAATSFVDPLLVGSVDVLRGPASTFYGSGALGGVMQVFPAVSTAAWLAGGWDSDGDENYLAGGWGANGWSFNLARRTANNSSTPDGEELNSGFEQYSATLSKQWQGASGRSYSFSLLPSLGRDIQKSNTDFPNRVTIYPEESHLLARFGITTTQGWRLNLFAHPNELETKTTRVGDRVNTVNNEALDFGLNAVREVELERWRTTARFGFEYFARRGVTATERQLDFDRLATTNTALTSTVTTLDGQEDELSAYGSLRRGFGKVSVEAGGRFSWLGQRNSATDVTTTRSLNDTATSLFAGVTVPLGNGFEAAANLGTGLRFPSLSERFFSGTTGRGQVVGNGGLDPERSLNADLSLRWFGTRLFVSGSFFRNEIDDYIERIETAPGSLTFVNLTSGRIEGVEVEGFFQPATGWHLSWSAHRLRGRSNEGTTLGDIPVDRLRLALRHERGSWRFNTALDLRNGKDDPGSGEFVIASAQLLKASVMRQLDERWALTLSANNLLDQSYRRSADNKAPLAPGRSFALGFRLGLSENISSR